MAEIMPFRGTRFNIAKVGDIRKVVAMPYDRIKHGLQDKYYAASDHNICRISKNKETSEDNPSNNPYTRAAAYLREWLDSRVLIEDSSPAIYAYHQEFKIDGQLRVRKGFCAMVELEDYDKGGVKPHERTLDAPKEDRLKLLLATDMHMGQIFQLYPDNENFIAGVFEEFIQRQPDIETTIDEEPGVIHKLWAVTDTKAIARIQEAMAGRPLFIADGHHRYETALNYRNLRLAEFKGGEGGHNPKFAMMTMVGMSDPGLVVLPTQRILHDVPNFDFTILLEKLNEFFAVTPCENEAVLLQKMDTARLAGDINAYGIYENGAFWYIQLEKPDIMATLAPEKTDAWRSLDVAVLHEVVFENILGIGKEAQAAKTNISYERDREVAKKLVDDGSHHCAIFMNPTRMDQIREVAGMGEVMPQKSTDFYPKLITGLVMCRVDLGEKGGRL
jgi:uncharacterized protein (DUF1015 family)